MKKRGMGKILLIIIFSIHSFALISFGEVAFKAPVIELKAEPNLTFSTDLRSFLSEGASENLVWTLGAGAPAWLTLDSVQSMLRGTPNSTHTGTTTFRLTVVGGDTGAIALVRLTVAESFGWIQDEINLGIAFEDESFIFDLAKYVIGGTPPLQFSAKRLPPWLVLSPTGILRGIPHKHDLGDFGDLQFTVSSVNSSALPKIAYGYGKVAALQPHGPVAFKADQFTFSLKTQQRFDLDLNSLLAPNAPNRCQWAITGLPTWLSLDSKNGSVAGNPPLSEAGITYTTRVKVACGDQGAIAVMTLNVANGGTPVTLSWSVKERDTFRDKLPVPGTQNSPFSDSNVFSLVGDSTWVTVFGDGEVEIRPHRQDLGEHLFIYQVKTDSQIVLQGRFRVLVQRSPRPPLWKIPSELIATQDKEFSIDLCKWVTSVDEDPFTTKIQSGPGWLKMESACVAKGIPIEFGAAKLTLVACIDEVCATAATTITVQKSNHPPQWITDPVILPQAHANIAYSQDLSRVSTDPDGDPLTFSKITGAPWVTVAPNGLLAGTPRNLDVGAHRFVIKACDLEGLCSVVTASLEVQASNNPPIWTKNPIVLPEAKEDVEYCWNVNEYAVDPDGDPLVFEEFGTPEWMHRTDKPLQNCGTPKAKDVGLTRFEMAVHDLKGGTSRTTVIVNVIHSNHAPFAKLNPIITTAQIKTPFSISLAPYVIDPDPGDFLLFAKMSGPNWLQISPDGNAFGTAGEEALGENEAIIRVTDSSGLSITVKLLIRVQNQSHPPRWDWTGAVVPPARPELAYSFDISPYAKDSDLNDPLTFTLLSGPEWLQMTDNGILLGIPSKKDVGVADLRLRVKDPMGNTADTSLKIPVLSEAYLPEFNPPKLAPAKVGKLYLFELSGFCHSPHGSPVQFKKVSGPSWIQIDSAGKLIGVPQITDAGTFQLRVECRNEVAAVEKPLLGEVIR